MSSSIQPYPTLVLAQQILERYGYSFIAVIGMLGNLFNICLFLRKTLRTTSCNNYFLASAFVNLVIISVGIIPILYVYDRSWAIITPYCKIRTYFYNASQQISRFLIVAACFDRFALCSTSLHLRQFCRVHIARRYMIPSIIIIWLIIPIHLPIFLTAINNNCMMTGVAALYNSIYSISLIGFIPPSLMLIFSLLTFRNLKSRQRRRQIRPFANVNPHLSANGNRKRQKKDQQAFGMLIIQVVVYVCTTTLNSSNTLYSVLTTYLGTNKSAERKSIEAFITFILGMLNYSCPCFSFYLFILVSRLYRKQMKLLILFIYRRCRLPCGININNNGNESIQLRQMNARVEPIQQPAVISSAVEAD